MQKYQVWEVKEGLFTPFQITPSKNVNLITTALNNLELPKNTSIYLRGSFLENNTLYQNSDIDLVVIAEFVDETLLNKLRRKLSFTKRSIEILSLTPAQIDKNDTFRLLLHTRSLLIKGPECFFNPVKACLEAMKDHFFHYKPHMIYPLLSMDKSTRLIQLKAITRSYVILYFLHTRNKFSRDIETCVIWAMEIDKNAGHILKRHWENLDDYFNYKREDLSKLKSTFLIESEVAIKKYLNFK